MIVFHWIRFIIATFFLLSGLIILLATAVGIFRFKNVLNRIHVAAKCDTFGILMVFSSLMIMSGFSVSSLKLLLVIVFLWLSNPVSGHLIAHLEFLTNPEIKKECKIKNADLSSVQDFEKNDK